MSPALQKLTGQMAALYEKTKGDPEVWHSASDELIEKWFDEQGASELAEMLRNSERWYA